MRIGDFGFEQKGGGGVMAHELSSEAVRLLTQAQAHAATTVNKLADALDAPGCSAAALLECAQMHREASALSDKIDRALRGKAVLA